MRNAELRLGLFLILVAVLYLPSLWGGFLGYDDDWMIENNAFYATLDLRHLTAIWFDLSSPTRLSLGAEYLPVRDTSVFLDLFVFGKNPQAMRAVNLALYLGASAWCVSTWRRVFGQGWVSDGLAAFFVLHPAHVESVAWIVGRKDVLGLLFFWIAARMHVAQERKSTPGIVVCLLLAQLSKFLFVASPLLLWLLDVEKGRQRTWRQNLGVYAPLIVACLLPALLQIYVAERTTMAGGVERDIATRLSAMGPVWWGYVKTAFWGIDLNVMHDVTIPETFSARMLSGYLVTVAFWAVVTLAVRPTAGVRALVAPLWFFVPLLPASQLLVSIQNFHEDRYLVLSIMGAGLAYRNVWDRFKATDSVFLRRAANVAALFLLIWFCWATTHRAFLFADPVRLFTSATAHSRLSPTAPYQLGIALERRGQPNLAIVAYQQALDRPDARAEAARRATNNLARLYARQENYAQAERVLRRGVTIWPSDPKILGNLAEVLWLSENRTESRRLYERLVATFPDYAPGVARYRAHFMPPP